MTTPVTTTSSIFMQRPLMGFPFFQPLNATDPNHVEEQGYWPYVMNYSAYQCRTTPKYWWMGQYAPVCHQPICPGQKCPSFQ